MPPESSTPAYDRERWMRALESMARALGKDGQPVQLCLIGSAACIFAGMDLRVSEGLDIWQPSSDYDLTELKNAAEAAGLSCNPTGILEPDQPYLQIIEPGIVQIGKFKPVPMFKMGRLIVSRPPIENIIASKLTRAADKDIQDILYLIKTYQPDIREIKTIVQSFPHAAKAQATENLIYLDVTL